jgi:hypothetical protein
VAVGIGLWRLYAIALRTGAGAAKSKGPPLARR